MANGDIASAMGLFTPVSSGAEYRLGYDDINRLADALAWLGGGQGWTTSNPFGSASGWGSYTDPGGSSLFTNGSYRRLGPSMLEFSFMATYTGATVTPAAGGNVADMAVCTINDTRCRPLARRLLSCQTYTDSVNGNIMGQARVETDGRILLTNIAPGGNISSGQVWLFQGLVGR